MGEGLPSSRNRTPCESRPTSVWSFITRIPDQPVQEAKQMTATTAAQAAMVAGAASHDTMDWHAIDWRRVHQTVRRLQARIVKAIHVYTASCHKGVSKGLSRISGNRYVRFLGEEATVTPPP